MEKFMLWLQKNKVCMALLALFVFIVPLAVVHFLFKFDSGVEWIRAEWSAGETLAYIAGFLAFIGTVSLGALALWQNRQIHGQHIETLAPALSMNLISLRGMLYLTIENTGQSEARKIQIKIESIENNGDNAGLMLDDLFSSTFDLFPKETVQGRITLLGLDVATQIFPLITVDISYVWLKDSRMENYKRRVIYDNGYAPKTFVDDENNFELGRSASDIDSIARAIVRIANYLDGCQVAKFDELNILAGKSLRNDIVDALKTKEEVPVLSRIKTIEKSLGIKRTTDRQDEANKEEQSAEKED